ncbi:MAG: exonuclease SbcCD subunit D [Ruminococcus sp.]|nr:exonuclease SbcCD subunit D [Ruminococcus sp.]
MRLLHIADLHIGRRLHGYPLIDLQRDVLKQILAVIRDEQIDAVLIAGDVYDKPQPSVEALELFGDFLTQLHQNRTPVYMISGNHDAAGRISYLAELIRAGGIHTVPAFEGKLCSIAAGEGIIIHLLPFVRPMDVRPFCPEQKIETYEDAVRAVIAQSEIDPDAVNILIGHQFVSGGIICDSEEFAVGGLDHISPAVFDDFDYVALGHLHRAQSCTRETLRYAGSPLKYSLSEEQHKKSFTIVEVNGKDDITIRTVPALCARDVRTVRGTFAELVQLPYTEDFVQVILTDELPPPDAVMVLRTGMPYLLRFRVENEKTKYDIDVTATETMEQKSPLELLSDFYALQNNGVRPSEEQMQLAASLFDACKEECL